MEAPGEEELEWMAMEQLHRQEDNLVDEFFDQMIHNDHVDSVVEEEMEVSYEAVEISKHQNTVKRKKLVFPEIPSLSPVNKSQKTHADEGPSQELNEVVNEETPSTTQPVLETPVVNEEPLQPVLKTPYKRAADIAGDFIPITGPSGERVYAEVFRNVSSEPPLLAKHEGQLLSESIEEMIQQIERESLERACGLNGDEEKTSPLKKVEQLWVDKYAPQSFTELLSDEQTNREVLSWLKQWDPCVYGARRHSTRKEVLSSLRQQKSSTRHHSDKLAGTHTVLADRPEQKVLLLCGPPGLGKTTLAHVAAKHCGYRIVEINASDDRTSASLQTKILDAIQMKPVTGDSRPNCLIIDEIDGAFNGMEGKSAISFLLELINAEPLPKASEPGTVKPKKKKNTVSRLSRPIICICNNLYAPALRPLRGVARIHVFSPPSSHRIVTRLKFICKAESYEVNARALTALAVHTESDIRSCLNTLQFLHQNGHRLKTLDVGSQVIGKKDMTSSMFDIWFEIFSKRKPKPGASTGINQAQEEFNRLHNLFANHGEYDLGFEGIFENFLHVHYHDAYLQKTIACLDLLGDSDIFGRRVISHQQFFLNNYRPSIEMGIRRLIAQTVRPKLEWPKSSQRCKQMFSENREILKTWLISISPGISRGILCASLVQDILSPLLSILSPNLRPVASNLLSRQEREEIKQLVDTMINYGLRYKKSKPENLNKISFEAFTLHPPLYSFIKFKDYVHKHTELSFTIQQMLSHEVEIEAIKRESLRCGASKDEPSSVKERVTKPILKPPECTAKKTVTEVVSITKKTTVKTVKQGGFFDRFKTESQKRVHASSEVTTAKRDSRPLLFKFHEGFTNAVKKPVLMRDLLN